MMEWIPGRGSAAGEDYVKVIYAHTEWQDEPITPSQLAAKLQLAASSVTEMVKKLAAAGLVDHKPYGAVELTDRGRTLALQLLRRHRLIETWLVVQQGYQWDEVHEEADVLEHAMSDRLVESIAVSLGNPARDPHGDPIPTADGEIVAQEGIRVLDAPVGMTGSVIRISDSDGELLRFLAQEGIEPDVPVEVLERAKFSGTVKLRTPDGETHLGPEAAAAVYLALTPTEEAITS